METLHPLMGKIAGIVSIVAFVPYIIAIVRRQTTPNLATWWIWTAVGVFAAASNKASGAEHSIWVSVTYAIGPFITLLFSLKYGEPQWTWFDYLCLVTAASSLLVWWWFNSPLLALLMNLFVDFLGALPTMWKAYQRPHSEDKLAWFLLVVGNFINLFAVDEWTFHKGVYAVDMFIVYGTMAGIVFLRPLFLVPLVPSPVRRSRKPMNKRKKKKSRRR